MRRWLQWACLATCLAGAARAEEAEPLAAWPLAARGPQRAYEAALNAVPDAMRLRAWHDLFCREPHPAGSEGDARMIERMAKAFETMGLETERHEFHAWLPRFEGARVTVHAGDEALDLPLRERRLPEDPAVAERVPPAWNAYSGSGEVRGEVVYANYGTKEDFAQLAALGVDLTGRIVVARYGRNFRGFKAKFAEAAGAAGLLLYTDPDDSGYRKGIPYPEGGWANETSVQRGSIKTLPYPGDPLTPFEPATKDARRLDPESVALPRIPVQPLGWRAAREILARMRGPGVPQGWQGGLPFAYRLTGGEHLEVALEVRQERAIVPTANVIGRVRGSRHPEQVVIVGCHHDAWTFGAGDPAAGSIVLFEMARSFAQARKQGHRPARTVIFANWGAEEPGIIGSTEWCEANRAALAAGGVAYVNLDMAAMGPNFHCSASPSLKSVIEDAARAVPQARADGRQSVYDAWAARGDGTPGFGNLGGGSDHVGFYCHLGIPSCGLGAGGSAGVSYHSAYDTVSWYRKVVGEDYAPALMLARLGNVLVSRLANAPVLPYDPVRAVDDMRTHLDALRERAAELGVPLETAALDEQLPPWRASMQEARVLLRATPVLLEAAHGDPAERLAAVNEALIQVERAWLLPGGLPGRPWFRQAFAASDPTSGYAAWMLPVLRQAVEDGADAEERARALGTYRERLFEVGRRILALIDALRAAAER